LDALYATRCGKARRLSRFTEIPAYSDKRGEIVTVLHTAVYGVLVVGGVCLVSLAGLELVHRLVPAQSRQRHNDVAGFIYAALGVIYAVLLALVVIAV
jgi:hypothetical protein